MRNGHIKRITYSDIRSSVLEIMSELCVGDHVDQHIDDVRHLPLRREQNARDQAPVSRHDNQECEQRRQRTELCVVKGSSAASVSNCLTHQPGGTQHLIDWGFVCTLICCERHLLLPLPTTLLIGHHMRSVALCGTVIWILLDSQVQRVRATTMN